MTTVRVALPASEVVVNVTRWAPICAPEGFHVYVAVAGFPSVCRRTAPGGDPESRIASVEPSDVAERRNESVVLAVQRHDEPSLSSRAEGRHEILVAQRGELGDSTVAEERFHTDGATLGQLAHADWIRVDKTAPETEVDDG